MNYSLHRINEIKSLSSRLYDLIVNFESLISCILKVKGTRAWIFWWAFKKDSLAQHNQSCSKLDEKQRNPQIHLVSLGI